MTQEPGLRRQEVALLAGVSVDYYTQMERWAGGVVNPAARAVTIKLVPR